MKRRWWRRKPVAELSEPPCLSFRIIFGLHYPCGVLPAMHKTDHIYYNHNGKPHFVWRLTSQERINRRVGLQ